MESSQTLLPVPASGDVLRALPRRQPLATGAGEAKPTQMRTVELPPARVFDVALRLVAWGWPFALYLLSRLIDRLGGRYAPAERAKRLRRTVEHMGPRAIEIGRLMGQRVDLLPAAMCRELATLPSQRKPFPVAHAIGQIEATCGLPMEAVFEAFDPEPVVSDYVGCTYQAVLRTGEPVSVRVVRPQARRKAKADLVAIGFLLWALEFLTIVRPGFLGHVRKDLDTLLATELDMLLQGRYQRLFRRYARKGRIRGVGSPRNFPALSGKDVLVSARPQGVPLSDVLAACSSQDEAALAKLARMEIDPLRVARRLLKTNWWGLYEALFFDLAPDPSTILVQPGDRLVFCSFPGGGASPTPKRELHREVLRRLSQRDPSGAADVLVQLLAPLPFIDVGAFRKRVEVKLWARMLAMEDKKAPPVERTSIGVWRALLDTARAQGVPVHMDALRLMAAASAVDAMVAVLRPKVDLLDEFERYTASFDRRRARRFVRDLDQTLNRDVQAMVVARVAEATETFNRLGFWLEANSRTLPVEYISLSSKGSYAISIVLRLIVVVCLVGLGLGGLSVVDWGVDLAFSDILTHWVTLGLGAVLLVLGLRRILFRLNDLEEAG